MCFWCQISSKLLDRSSVTFDICADEKEDVPVKRRGRPRKRKIEGKRLFDDQGSSEDEDSISASDHENDDEEENAPLINSIRSSRLRSLKEANKGSTKKVEFASQTKDNLTASMASGGISFTKHALIFK